MWLDSGLYVFIATDHNKYAFWIKQCMYNIVIRPVYIFIFISIHVSIRKVSHEFNRSL
jgi:hypothetical protein